VTSACRYDTCSSSVSAAFSSRSGRCAVELLPDVRPVGLVVARVAVHGEDRGRRRQPTGAGELDERR
jgi:hypothetical protein